MYIPMWLIVIIIAHLILWKRWTIISCLRYGYLKVTGYFISRQLKRQLGRACEWKMTGYGYRTACGTSQVSTSLMCPQCHGAVKIILKGMEK